MPSTFLPTCVAHRRPLVTNRVEIISCPLPRRDSRWVNLLICLHTILILPWQQILGQDRRVEPGAGPSTDAKRQFNRTKPIAAKAKSFLAFAAKLYLAPELHLHRVRLHTDCQDQEGCVSDASRMEGPRTKIATNPTLLQCLRNQARGYKYLRSSVVFPVFLHLQY